MIYYNSIKQFIKDLFNFILSLFTKKFLLMIIVILFILLFHLNVHAESVDTSNDYVYRTPITSSYDDQKDGYYYTGIYYNENGKTDVNIFVPSSFMTGSFWICNDIENSSYMLVRMHDKRSFDSFYINYGKSNGPFDSSWGDWNRYFSLSPKTRGINNFDTFKYDVNNEIWHTDLSNASGNYGWKITPTNVLIQYNCTVYYSCMGVSEFYSADQLKNYNLYRIPTLSLVNNGFQVDLLGFSFYGQQFNDRFNNENISHKYQLDKFYISVYDLNNKQYTTNLTDILLQLSVSTTGTDKVTGYPIQTTILDFNTFFNYMNNTTVNQDYLIFIHPVLKDTNSYIKFTDPFQPYYNYITDLSYYRYKYNASTGVGSLVPTDSEGKPIEPSPNPDDDDTNNEEINNNLNNINNSIQDINDNLFNTNADDITLDDFGVSTPNIEGSPDLTNIFDLIYNSFMSVYEDDIYRIQFGLPSGDTTYNFDIPANALRDKLPESLIVLISVFWWVVLGGAVISFIVRIIHQIVTYSNGSVDEGGSSGGFLSELTMTPTEFVLFNILH